MACRNDGEQSLGFWRSYFRCADPDIFVVIMSAIEVARADRLREVILKRSSIVDALYPKDKIDPDDESEDYEEGEVRDGDVVRKEGFDDPIDHDSDENYKHIKDDDDVEAALRDGDYAEAMRIKDVLTDWQEKSEKDLFESLRRLQSMRLSFETLTASDIEKSLDGLQYHTSNQICQLAQCLIQDWRILAAERETPKTPFYDETIEEYVIRSPPIEENELPSPPVDLYALLTVPPTPRCFLDWVDDDDDETIRNSCGELEKNERNDQQDSNNLVRKEDGETRIHEPALRLQKPIDAVQMHEPPRAFNEKATVRSSTHKMQEPAEARVTYIQDVPKKSKESCYQDMSKQIRSKAQLNNKNPGRKEDGEMRVHEPEPEVRQPKPTKVFNQEANVGSNMHKMQEVALESEQFKKTVFQGKFIRDARKTLVGSNKPLRIEDGVKKPLKPVGASKTVRPLSQALHKKVSCNASMQKRHEHAKVPSKPSRSSQDVKKQPKELLSQAKLEKSGNKTQPSNLNSKWKEDGKKKMQEEEYIRQSQTLNRKANAGIIAQKKKEHAEVPVKTSQPLRSVPNQLTESSVQKKIESTKRKLHESYQEAINAKKQRTIQAVESKNPPAKGRKQQKPLAKLGKKTNGKITKT